MRFSVFDVAAEHPSALALVTPEARFSYAELAAQVQVTAEHLAARALLQPHSAPVALVTRPGLASMCALYAVGAQDIPVFVLPPRLPADERTLWAARAGARAVIDPGELAAWPRASAPALPSELDPSAPLAVVPSSG